VAKVVPSDKKGGASHNYAHKSCIKQSIKPDRTELPQTQYDWVGMKGKVQTQTSQAHKFLLKHMGIDKPLEYDENSMNFFKSIGDMGLMCSNQTSQRPPTGTVYRTHYGKQQCMEFVHFDKLFGMEINPDDLNPYKRVPIMSNYVQVPDLTQQMKKYRENAFDAIYNKDSFVERLNKVTGKIEKLNLVENEAQFIDGFSADHVFIQEPHHGLLDNTHRWWNKPFTFRILIDGADVGIMEFKIIDNYSSKQKLHPGKSLFVYNVAAHAPGSNVCPYVFWFAKNLALYMNRFTDIKTYDEDRINQVYLTTSSFNKAMKRDAPLALFTEVITDKLWWNRDYFWNVPYVHTYSHAVDDFPTNIVASLAVDSYVPAGILSDSRNIIDTLLMPNDSEMDPSLDLLNNPLSRNTRRTTIDIEPVDLHEYHFNCPVLSENTVIEPETTRVLTRNRYSKRLQNSSRN
jgi:hypothetical protein